MPSVNERLARIETLCEGTNEKVSQLFAFHNNTVSPAISKVGVLDTEFKEHKEGHWKVALAIPATIGCILALLTYFGSKGGNHNDAVSKITAGVESK